jgi:hypothetical protein
MKEMLSDIVDRALEEVKNMTPEELKARVDAIMAEIPDEDTGSFFIEKAVGISVIHLIAYSEGGKRRVPEMDYHIHNLLYDDRELGHLGIYCLDLNDIQSAPYEPDADISDKKKLFNELNFFIAQFFVDKIDSLIKIGVFDEGRWFHRAEQSLWDKFNELKQQTFIAKVTKFRATKEDDAPVNDDLNFVPYKWAKLAIAEERLLNSSL